MKVLANNIHNHIGWQILLNSCNTLVYSIIRLRAWKIFLIWNSKKGIADVVFPSVACYLSRRADK
jgi:hypothetical protein